MNSNLDALFGKSAEPTAPSEGVKKQRAETEAQKWLANQQSLFANVKRNLERKPEGVDASEVYKAMGIKHGGTYTFKLKNGDSIKCDLLEFKGRDEIEEKTEVHEANGRDQDGLTRASLSDITGSIEQAGENLFAGVGGYTESGGKLTVFDGSRRRMACIYTDSTFRIYVPRDIISAKDAKYIADISRLTKKLSYREEGQELLRIFNSNESLITFEQLAEYVGQSKGAVSKKISAAKIPQRLVEVFPDYNGMTREIYAKLATAMKAINKSAVEECKLDFRPPSDKEGHEAYNEKLAKTADLMTDIHIEDFTQKSEKVISSDLTTKKHQDELVKLLMMLCMERKPAKEKPVTIAKVSKNKYITRTSTGKGDRKKVSFTVSHMSESNLRKVEELMEILLSEEKDR